MNQAMRDEVGLIRMVEAGYVMGDNRSRATTIDSTRIYAVTSEMFQLLVEHTCISAVQLLPGNTQACFRSADVQVRPTDLIGNK